jgi:hypothetical protein
MIHLISHLFFFGQENHASLYATTYLIGQFDAKKNSYESFEVLKFRDKG